MGRRTRNGGGTNSVRRARWRASPQLAIAILGGLLLASCPSGLGNGTTFASGATVDEVVASVQTLGFALPSQLPAPITDVRSLTVGVAGVGTVTFFAFVTTAPADSVDGTGHPLLDSEMAVDTNGAADVFLAAVDSAGQLLDVALISRAGDGFGTCRAANGASTSPSLAYFDSFGTTCGLDPHSYVRIAFESLASDLVPAGQDTNGAVSDVFVAAAHVFLDEDGLGNPAPGKLNLRVPTPSCGTTWGMFDFPTEIVSWSNVYAPGNGPSYKPSISTDGIDVVFESDATNLLFGGTDTNAQRDVFRRPMYRPPSDHYAGCIGPIANCSECHGHDVRTADLISRSTSGATIAANGGSFRPVIVQGPQFEVIGFESTASNLVAGDTNAVRDAFYAISPYGGVSSLHRASVMSGGAELHNGASRNASAAILGGTIGSPEVLVAFESDATDLPKPLNSTTNVYLHDNRGSGTTTLLNQRVEPQGATLGSAANGSAPADSRNARVNAAGTKVVFETLADNLDPSGPRDDNGVADVMLADLAHLFDAGQLRIQHISVASDGSCGNSDSDTPFAMGSYSAAAGGTEAFSSNLASKLMSARCVNCHGFNSNPRPASFPSVHEGDLWPPDQCNLCHRPAETGVASWKAPPASLSFHDKTIAELCAQVMSVGDAAAIQDHMENDTRILWALGVAQANGQCWVPSSGDPNNNPGVFRGSVSGGAIEWAAQVDAWAADGMQCVDFAGAGGDVIGYSTLANNIATSGPGPVIAFPSSARIERVSKTSGFAPSGGKQVNGLSTRPSATRDDRYIAFETTAAIAPADHNGVSDVYVRDLLFGTTTLVSHANASQASANAASSNASAHVDSGGVLYVAFESNATDVVPGFNDNNGASSSDVYWATFANFDGSAASILVTMASSAAGSAIEGGNGHSANPSLGGTSSVFIAFDSAATDLLAGFSSTATSDVYRRQLTGGSGMQLVSRTAAGALFGANGASSNPSINSAGNVIAFESLATDLAVAPTYTRVNAADAPDVFLWSSGTLKLISFSSTSVNTGANGASRNPRVGDQGTYIVFESDADNLVAGFVPNNGAEPDVFAVSTVTMSAELLSTLAGSATDGANGGSYRPDVGYDGTTLEVVFESLANDLSATGDTVDALAGIYSRIGSTVTLLSRGKDGQFADGDCSTPDLGSVGGVLAFDASASNLVGANVDTNGKRDVYRVEH